MMVTLNTIESNKYDLCIVGAGPAGIILALEYSKTAPGKKVLLVEMGKRGTTRNSLDDTIKNHNPINHFDAYDCTNKGLGGTSETWGGRCVMYDEIDFVPHGPVTEQCTWTLNFLHELNSSLDATAEYFHCGSGEFDLSKLVRIVPPMAENFRDGPITSTRLERWSLPTRFGREYGSQLANSAEIHVVTGCVAQHLEFANGSISSLTAELDGKRIVINAETFVLCSGGQEATRMLLRNPQVFSEIGGPPRALGQFYQGHLSGKIAQVKFHGAADATQFGYVKLDGNVLARRRFQLTTEAIQRDGLLNIAWWLDNHPMYDWRHRNGVLSFIYLMLNVPFLRKRLLHSAMARTITNDQSGEIFLHVRNVLRDLPQSLFIPAWIFAKRYLPRRRLPGVHLKNRDNVYALHFHCEQIPREENRMWLSKDGAELNIAYTYSSEEIDLVIKAHELLDSELRRQGCGELVYLFPKSQLAEAVNQNSKDGLHQVGTTRIAESSADGVVDSELRVFGTKNLFVCSSSVFPTSGQANPTFMLGACAVRLARQLSQNGFSKT